MGTITVWRRSCLFVALGIPGGAAFAQDTAESGDLWSFLGHFHPVILHFPIGLILALLAFEVVSWPLGDARRGDTGRWVMLGIGAFTAIVAAVFGIFLSWTATYDADLLWEHKWTGIAVAVAISLAVVCRLWFNTTSKSSALWGYRITVLAAAGFLLPAGHHGGELTHGSGFLATDIPASLAFLKPLLGGEAHAAAAVDVGDEYFAREILPVLEAKCFECHNAEKQKGDLRMDSREAMLLAGETGNACLVPELTSESFMMELMLLPPENEDRMPPAGKPQLEPQEIVALAEWINRGAPWGAYEPPPPAEPEAEEEGVAIDVTAIDGAGVAPIVKSDEMMELFFEEPPARMAQALKAEPIETKDRRKVLQAVFKEANLLAEAHNLLFSRNDEEYMATPEWVALTIEGRNASVAITEYLKDREWAYEELKTRYVTLIDTCNKCHVHFETDADEILAWPEDEKAEESAQEAAQEAAPAQ